MPIDDRALRSFLQYAARERSMDASLRAAQKYGRGRGASKVDRRAARAQLADAAERDARLSDRGTLMERIPVIGSSAVKSIGHDGVTLEVQYVSGGVYRFGPISADRFDAIMHAESLGRALNELKKDVLVTCERVEEVA